MATQTSETKPAPKAKAAGMAMYVVQIAKGVSRFADDAFDAGPDEAAWVDIATVALPARAHRRSAIAKAFAEAGVKPSAVREACDDPLLVRVLDVASATVTKVPVEVPEPRFVI